MALTLWRRYPVKAGTNILKNPVFKYGCPMRKENGRQCIHHICAPLLLQAEQLMEAAEAVIKVICFAVQKANPCEVTCNR